MQHGGQWINRREDPNPRKNVPFLWRVTYLALPQYCAVTSDGRLLERKKQM